MANRLKKCCHRSLLHPRRKQAGMRRCHRARPALQPGTAGRRAAAGRRLHPRRTRVASTRPAGRQAHPVRAARRPGRKSAPRKGAARTRVIELRREGLSVYEISTGLGQEGTPLGRTAVSGVLREEGFGRAAAGHPGPRRLRPARAGHHGRLPRHHDDPRRQLPAIPAGPQAHRHPARVPRRRPAHRPRTSVVWRAL